MCRIETEAASTRLARTAGVLMLVMAAAAMFAELGVRTDMVAAGRVMA